VIAVLGPGKGFVCQIDKPYNMKPVRLYIAKQYINFFEGVVHG
jgi:hypothetical protein